MRFDLAYAHPHAPGYPVYVGLARAIDSLFMHAPARSLSLVGAMAFGLLAAVTFAIGRLLVSRAAAIAATVVLFGSTTVVVHATRPLSDMLGAALGWSVVACGIAALLEVGREGRAGALGVVLFALLCGTRVSNVPLALPALIVCARACLRARVAGRAAVLGLVATAAWLVPLLWVARPSNLYVASLAQARGHFHEPGITSFASTGATGRASAVATGLWTHVLGGYAPDRPRPLIVWSTAIVALGVFGLVATWRSTSAQHESTASRRNAWACLAACALAQFAWVAVAQNVVWQPRHLMPLAPALALVPALGVSAIAAGAASAGRVAHRVGLYALLALASIALVPGVQDAHRLARLQATLPPPAVRIADYVRTRLPAEGTVVLSSQLAAWIRFRAADHRVFAVRDAAAAREIARRTGLRIFVTSETPGIVALRSAVQERARVVADRYVTTTMYDLALLEIMTP